MPANRTGSSFVNKPVLFELRSTYSDVAFVSKKVTGKMTESGYLYSGVFFPVKISGYRVSFLSC